MDFKVLTTRMVLLLAISANTLYSCKTELRADIVIRYGTVYNGHDLNPTNYSIAIKDDKIVYVGDESNIIIKALKPIDAKGLVVSPGFIDPHTHADRDLIDSTKSHNQPFLFQGITTVVVGNDGDSYYPSAKFKELYMTQGIGTNAVLLIGHGTIREQVMGKSDRKATQEEIARMQRLIQQEMETGAFGMSTGLFYAPGSYSNTEEVIALAEVVAKNDGIYDTHLRDESSYSVGLIPAIEEALEIGRQARLPIHISHIKCLGTDVWNLSDSIVQLVESARKEGIVVTANQYPYDASATGLQAAVVPRWAESGGKDSLYIRLKTPKFKAQILAETKTNIIRRGGPDKLLIVRANDHSLKGKNLSELSEELKIPPELVVFQILQKGDIGVASFNMTPNDITNFMRQDWVVTGSDGNLGHPRKYGAFPRKYDKYVKQDSIIDMATFINGSTSKTAEIFRIPNRGQIKVGHYADIIVFNPETFKDMADYNNPFERSDGLEYSIINGKLTIENGAFNGNLNGRVLEKYKAN